MSGDLDDVERALPLTLFNQPISFLGGIAVFALFLVFIAFCHARQRWSRIVHFSKSLYEHAAVLIIKVKREVIETG